MIIPGNNATDIMDCYYILY